MLLELPICVKTLTAAIKKVREAAHGSFPVPTSLADHIRI